MPWSFPRFWYRNHTQSVEQRRAWRPPQASYARTIHQLLWRSIRFAAIPIDRSSKSCRIRDRLGEFAYRQVFAIADLNLWQRWFWQCPINATEKSSLRSCRTRCPLHWATVSQASGMPLEFPAPPPFSKVGTRRVEASRRHRPNRCSAGILGAVCCFTR